MKIVNGSTDKSDSINGSDGGEITKFSKLESVQYSSITILIKTYK